MDLALAVAFAVLSSIHLNVLCAFCEANMRLFGHASLQSKDVLRQSERLRTMMQLCPGKVRRIEKAAETGGPADLVRWI